MAKPAPIARGALYRLEDGRLVRATLQIGSDWYGRVRHAHRDGEPITPIPPDAVLVEAYVPRQAASAVVADPVEETRRDA